MKSVNKKAAIREKLKSNFEWTTEAIEDFNLNGLSAHEAKSPPPVAANQLPPPDFMTKCEAKKDTMEEKIERVQTRKKLAGERAIKQLKNPTVIPRINYVLKEYQDSFSGKGSLRNMSTADVASRLNEYFREFLLDKPAENNGNNGSNGKDGAIGGRAYAATFPLHFFDVSTYDEVLLQPDWVHENNNDTSQNSSQNSSQNNSQKFVPKNIPKNNMEVNRQAVCLLSPSQLLGMSENTAYKGGSVPESSHSENEERNMCIGKWFTCTVLGTLHLSLLLLYLLLLSLCISCCCICRCYI